LNKQEKYKDLRDPIHGFIRIHEQELEIIDHRIFQRLRNIKQLSFAYTVYHGAEHSRFGHSLGVMHLADRILTNIKRNSQIIGDELDISDNDIQLCRFAALLHDVGHFPFSHASDNLIPDDHEDYSTSLVENVFAPSIEKTGVKVSDVNNLIKGKPPLHKPFLSSLINSQLDVDKFDYLLRDSHYAGVTYGIFDINRLIASLAVVDNDLLVLDSGYYAVEQMIISRYHMFEQLYYHHTKRVFEEMAKKVAEFMIKNKEMEYPKSNELDKESSLNTFVKYNDSWFMRTIKGVSNNDLKRVANQIEDRIPYRKILDSGDIWKKIKENDPAAGRGILLAIESDIQSSYDSYGLNESELIFDSFKSVPYKLKPYIRTTKGNSEDDEPEIIYIYNETLKEKRPVEDLSPIIRTLANEKFSTSRIYIEKSKFDLTYNKLKNKYYKFIS
jgi:HD superfamily phosphohydrolase